MTEESKIVPLFRTYEDMHRGECAIFKEHYDDWHAAYHRWDLIRAALKNDDAELTKLATDDSEQALAKSEAARLKAEGNGSVAVAEMTAMADLAGTLRALVEKRNGRLYGLGAVAKRSMRFAMATERRYFGPAATVTTIGVKQ